jgi:hypothetical protein
MLRNYRVAVAWRDATGHPVEGARETVEAELNKKCALLYIFRLGPL